jgi:hypothetical protein
MAMSSDDKHFDQLMSIALHDPSGDFVEAYLLGVAIGSSSVDIKSAAIIAIGNAVRVRRRLAYTETYAVLAQLASVPELGGVVEDAIGDIKMFSK